ncbi:MAG: hypothetical protein JHC33_11395 [Ignisphaera sp.]|nr:hypothetical protein [Ignisphaera sp.]
MLVADVLAQARSRLGDEAKHRWTDDRLVYIANQGQKQICKLSGILRREAYIPLTKNKRVYRLPTDCVTLRRVEYNDKILPIYSRSDTDDNLRLVNGMVAVKTNLAMGFLELYPEIPDFEKDVIMVEGVSTDSVFSVVPYYGVVTNIDEPYIIADVFGEIDSISMDYSTAELSKGYGEVVDSNLCQSFSFGYSNGEYGVVTAVDYSAPTYTKFGVITDTNNSQYIIGGSFGITTDISTPSSFIKVYYEAVPTTNLVYTSGFSIPDVWEDAMLKYIVGTALQDDNDANNIARGESEIAKFTNDVLKAREIASKDFSGGASKKLDTKFRRI